MRPSSPRPATHMRVTALLLLVLLSLALLAPGGARAATAPTLGTAQSFAILGGSTVTNTGATTITGNLGVSPGNAVTGFPPGNVAGGVQHTADTVALQAQSDVTTAYNALAGQPCDTTLTGQDLGGKTLVPGVYCYAAAAQLTGTLTLNAQGNANAVFIFQIGSTLTTASNATVQVINGGSPCNAYWQVGSSATLGTTTTFVGNILALTSITLTNGVGITGRALARNAAVTLDTNTVSVAACAAAAPTPTPTTSAAPPTATPGQPGVPGTTPTVGGSSPLPTTPPSQATPTAVWTPDAAAVRDDERGQAPSPTPVPANGTAVATPSAPAVLATTTPVVTATTPVPTSTATTIPTTPSPLAPTPGLTPTPTPFLSPTIQALPGLPNSGGGGPQQDRPATFGLLAALLVLLVGGAGLRLRRRTTGAPTPRAR
jgi:hypothetical protein